MLIFLVELLYQECVLPDIDPGSRMIHKSILVAIIWDFIPVPGTYLVRVNTRLSEKNAVLDVSGNFLIAAPIKKINKNKKIILFFSRRFRRGWLKLSLFSRFSPLRCPRQRRHHERYSYPSAVLLSAFIRNCRELSIEYLNSPEIGGGE